MAALDVVYEKFHLRHDPRWCARAGPGHEVAARSSFRVCVACVIELIDSCDASVVRKSMALTGVGELLKTEGVMREILQQDDRVCVHFTYSLLKMLQCVEDPFTLDKVMQVLVQLLLDLKMDHLVQHVMDELQVQLCDVKSFLVPVTLLGKLLDAVPAVAQMLTSTHLCVLESVCVQMVSADEELKAAVCYMFRGVWVSEVALHSMPHTLRERVCVLLLNTMTHACLHQLIVNCLGLLFLLLRSRETVYFLMNREEETCHPELQHRSLPLILKRLLLSGDESLQVASVQCVCAVLNHSTQYCISFIQDDIPEFLFERLSSSNDVLIWCVYSCVLLLCEDSLFFSQCHSVYGIESIVRSLKSSVKLSNLEVPKKGLQLLTVILEKQPAGVRLFPIGPVFGSVSEVVKVGMASPCLRVATQAARAATALMKMHHQSTPVHYGELKKIIEALSCRFTELPSRPISQRRKCLADSDSSSQSAKAGEFLLQALVCFYEACRLLEECVHAVKDSPLPEADQKNEDTLECVCVCVLKCCDTVYIPTVTRVCERTSSPRVLQLFLSILSVQFSLSPSLMPVFANKLASSGFIRLTLENKAVLCSGNRHASLNVACCAFLLKLCVCLLSQPDPETHSQHRGAEDVECVLRECLPSLYYRVCDWPAVLCAAPVANQNTQYCLLHLLYLSLIHGDRLLPDATVFSSIVQFINAAVERCETLPPSVLQSVLHLVSKTQESSSDLDWPDLKSISKLLSSTSPCSSPLSVPQPSLLHFIFRYPELTEQFGTKVLTGWLNRGKEAVGKHLDPEQTVLMELLEKNPSVLLKLLCVVFEAEEDVAECVVCVMKRFLTTQQNCSSVPLSLLKPSLLQLLHKLNCDSDTVVHGVSLMLEVLCVVQDNSTVHSDLDHTDFKLLYHISNLVGKMKCRNTEYLLPALNYLYCCLALSPTHTSDRVVSMLLCNTGLMELLQTLLDQSQSSSSSPSSPATCCSLLLLSSLITLQYTHSAQVHKSVCLQLESVLRTLMFWKRHTDSLLLVCTVRLLQAVLDVDLCSPVVCVSVCVELHPLSYRGAISFTTALQNLLLQKQEMLLSVSVNCLDSLIRFLNRGTPAIVPHVVCQPWNRFLLFSLLNSSEYLTLHPATLRLLTLLVHWSGDGVPWESDIECVCATAERREVKELRGYTIHTLKRLLFECSSCSLSEDLKLRLESLLESLDHLCPSESSTGCLLRVGRLSICLADITVNH